MDRFRTILSKAGVFSRLNRFSQTARPLSTQYTDSRRTNINSFSFRGESKNRFSQCFVQCNHLHRSFASEVKSETQSVSQVDFEHYCAETLESLTDYFDQLVEEFKELEAADVVCKVMQSPIDHHRAKIFSFTLRACYSFSFEYSGWSVDREFGENLRHLRDKQANTK